MLCGSNIFDGGQLVGVMANVGLIGEGISPLVIWAYWISCKPSYL